MRFDHAKELDILIINHHITQSIGHNTKPIIQIKDQSGQFPVTDADT